MGEGDEEEKHGGEGKEVAGSEAKSEDRKERSADGAEETPDNSCERKRGDADDDPAAAEGGAKEGTPAPDGQAGGSTHPKRRSPDVAFKSGDWYCQACGTHNFAFRCVCMKCDHPKLTHPVSTAPLYHPSLKRSSGNGCTFCNHLANQPPPRYTPRMGCWGAPFPSLPPSMVDPPPMYDCFPPYDPFPPPTYYPPFYRPPPAWRSIQLESPDDWDCWVCGHLNYARRTKCKSCGTEREKALPKTGGAQPRPGDWFCMVCQNVNFSKRDICNMCQSTRSEASNEIVLERIRGGS